MTQKKRELLDQRALEQEDPKADGQEVDAQGPSGGNPSAAPLKDGRRPEKEQGARYQQRRQQPGEGTQVGCALAPLVEHENERVVIDRGFHHLRLRPQKLVLPTLPPGGQVGSVDAGPFGPGGGGDRRELDDGLW